MADKEFLAALHEQEKLDQLIVDLDLAQYENVVISVNGKTGAVVLSTTDINEGTNLYYTNARADDRVALIIDDSITNLLKAWSGQKVSDAISAGSVESAKKWTTPMDFTFGGDLVGSGSFDGSAAALFSGTVPGKVDNARVLTDVPANAIFTDTVYDDTTIWDAVNLNTAKVGITAAQASAIEANTAHGSRIDNPHLVTAAQVGATPASHETATDNPHGVTAAQSGALSANDSVIALEGDGLSAENRPTISFNNSMEDGKYQIKATDGFGLAFEYSSDDVNWKAYMVAAPVAGEVFSVPVLTLSAQYDGNAGSEGEGGEIGFETPYSYTGTKYRFYMDVVRHYLTNVVQFRWVMFDENDEEYPGEVLMPNVGSAGQETLAFEAKGQISQFNTDMKMPKGWQICDGTKGTPDMTADFKTYGTTEVVYIQFTGNY